MTDEKDNNKPKDKGRRDFLKTAAATTLAPKEMLEASLPHTTAKAAITAPLAASKLTAVEFIREAYGTGWGHYCWQRGGGEGSGVMLNTELYPLKLYKMSQTFDAPINGIAEYIQGRMWTYAKLTHARDQRDLLERLDTSPEELRALLKSAKGYMPEDKALRDTLFNDGFISKYFSNMTDNDMELPPESMMEIKFGEGRQINFLQGLSFISHEKEGSYNKDILDTIHWDEKRRDNLPFNPSELFPELDDMLAKVISDEVTSEELAQQFELMYARYIMLRLGEYEKAEREGYDGRCEEKLTLDDMQTLLAEHHLTNYDDYLKHRDTFKINAESMSEAFWERDAQQNKLKAEKRRVELLENTSPSHETTQDKVSTSKDDKANLSLTPVAEGVKTVIELPLPKDGKPETVSPTIDIHTATHEKRVKEKPKQLAQNLTTKPISEREASVAPER